MAAATPAPRARRSAVQRKGRGDYHHGNLRRALLDAAVAILAEHGADSFTMREAARRVGVDHRAAYRHFADRDTLLAAVAEEGYRALIEKVSAELAQAGAHARGRLLAIAQAYTRFALHEPGRYQVMMGPHSYQRFPDTDAAVDGGFALVRDEVARGLARGELANGDPVDLAAWFWAAMHGLTHLILVRRIRVRRERVGELVERMVGRSLDGIVRPPR